MKKDETTFVQIPDQWAHKDLDINSRFILAVMHRYHESGKNYYMKRDTFCTTYCMDLSMYKRRLKFLLDQGLIVIDKALAKGIKEYRIDYDELEFFLSNGKRTVVDHNEPLNGHSEPQPGHSEPQFGHNEPHFGHSEPSLLPDNNQISNQIKISKEVTKPEDFSFDFFRDEVKQNDIDPKILSLAMDFDKDF